VNDPDSTRHASPPSVTRSLARRVAGLATLCFAGMSLPSAPLVAQVTQQDQSQTSLIWRLDQPSRMQLEVLFDSATKLGLPAEPLYAKTLEGISKGANGRRIVEYIRKYFAAMIDARAALGTATTDELSSAAGALLAGVDRDHIARMRRGRQGKSIAVPLVILSDLVYRGVPTGDASSAMVQLTQRGALDSDFQGLWLRINQDIVSGVPPAAALQRWTRDFPGRAPPGTRLPPGTAPPTSAPPRAPETPSTTPP
jgi:hypothetical protein